MGTKDHFISQFHLRQFIDPDALGEKILGSGKEAFPMSAPKDALRRTLDSNHLCLMGRVALLIRL